MRLSRILWAILLVTASVTTGEGALPLPPAPVGSYDVVVVGAGTGGCAAAISAARLGMRVALVEESTWIGGQLTASAVSTMDDVRRNRSGLYGEVISRIVAHYKALGRTANTCYWGSDTIACEPAVGQKILYDLLSEAQGGGPEGTGRVELFLETQVTAATMEGHRLVAVTGTRNFRPLVFRGTVFIDATECGDLIPLTGARYRVGNSIAPHIDPEANVQDITYVAVLRRVSGDLPPGMRLSTPPPGYDDHVKGFRAVVAKDGSPKPSIRPVNLAAHNAYRGLPDPENPLSVDCGQPHTWPRISKTGINWANDVPGNPGNQPGLSVRYIEDRRFRKAVDRQALLKTLQFLYYFQNEVGASDWTVDPTQGFGSFFSCHWEVWKDMPEEYAPVLSHFPPMPYVRESRRIVGLRTLTAADVERDEKTGMALRNFATSVALGEYPVDIHGSHLDRYLEHDLGEYESIFPSSWVPSKGVFQVPLEVLIPEEVDGLVAAEKNISVSRMVNGAIRLQPITLLTGQAAGTLAAVAVQRGVPPRRVKPLWVQNALWQRRSRLAMEVWQDVPIHSPWWPAVQAASLYGTMPSLGKKTFGADFPMKRRHAMALLRRAFPGHFGMDSSPASAEFFITRGEFELLMRLGLPAEMALPPTALYQDDLRGEITRGEALARTLEVLLAQR